MPVSVLVVEYDAVTRETIVSMLEAMKYTVIGVETAKMAYDVLDAVRFDVLIVSLALGDPDGVNIATDAKAYQRPLKVIVVSGRQQPDTLSHIVDAFVQKPFSLAQIDDALKKVTALAG